jgi:hypothetical protein
MVSEAIAQGDPMAINYFIAQKYVDALGKFADSSNGKLIFVPLEATNIAGVIGGVSELIKAAQSPDTSRPKATPSVPRAGV